MARKKNGARQQKKCVASETQENWIILFLTFGFPNKAELSREYVT
jgi:hypothetical protein